jgi:MFS family permease
LAPIGFFAGIFFAGVAAQFLYWGWYFFFGAIIMAIVAAASYLSIPSDGKAKQRDGIKMDGLGAVTVIPALILIVYGLTDGSHAPNGWATPYIPVTFVLGWVFLAAFIYIEGWVAEQPLLPGDMFNVKGIKPMVVALFFQYGTFGIFLFYASFYIQDILGASAILTSAWFAPMCVGGLILSLVGGMVLHLLPGSM